MSVTLDFAGLIVFGLGFWMFMDGLVFGVMPKTIRYILRQMEEVSDDDLRSTGLMCSAFGAGIVFLAIWFASGS